MEVMSAEYSALARGKQIREKDSCHVHLLEAHGS